MPIPPDPVAQFTALLARAETSEPEQGTMAALATADPAGRPSARMVLLRGVADGGFTFYTNYGSQKARELDANPQASLCFYWHSIDTQVRVEGRVERVAGADADAYFASRPRESQLGAWASRQSAPLESRATLEAGFHEMEARFQGVPVPRPPFWGGYRVRPDRIEFWTRGAHRLHDRIVYTRAPDGGWTSVRVYP